MNTWLSLLPLELSGINESEFIEPDYALEKNDQQIGEMPDTSKQLYTLGRLLEKDANQYHLDANYCNDKVTKSELEAKAHEFMSKATTIKELMWIGIRDEFGLWGVNIGVRTGFKVVTSPDTGNDIPPIIRGLLGM